MSDPQIQTAAPIRRRILLLVHNPLIPQEGGRPLSQVLGWNDPGKLVSAFVQEMARASHGAARFVIHERIDVDAFPRKADGFCYTSQTFLDSWRRRRGFHEPDLVDYPNLVRQFHMLERIRDQDIDEVWLVAFPYAGYYESIMAGPGAFWCNAPSLHGTRSSARRFVTMGFNYERGVGEMMESFGHRAESIMSHVYRRQQGDRNLWERFTRYDQTHPGMSEVGNVHFAPNSQRDYDWGNRRRVISRCEDWLHFPDLQGREKVVECGEWGGGDIRRHHRWWFQHFPHVEGSTSGISNNWWEYVLDPDRAV